MSLRFILPSARLISTRCVRPSSRTLALLDMVTRAVTLRWFIALAVYCGEVNWTVRFFIPFHFHCPGSCQPCSWGRRRTNQKVRVTCHGQEEEGRLRWSNCWW